MSTWLPRVATTYRERDRYYDEAARVVAEVAGARAGHYAVFVPSYGYLRQLALRLEDGVHELLVQSETMKDGDRQGLLDRLRAEDGRTRLLLAVQGGAFAEGVDYPGAMLVGVVVISQAAVLTLIASGLSRGDAPIYPLPAKTVSDPLSQAMALTAIVIGLAVTALLLVIVLRVVIAYRTDELDELDDEEAAREARLERDSRRAHAQEDEAAL